MKRHLAPTEHELTAFHEAGHQVAEERLGFHAGGCTIAPDGDRLGASRSYDDWLDEEAARKQLTALYAGYCAEVVAGQSKRKARLSARNDFERAAEIRKWLGSAADERTSLASTFVFIREPKNWRAVALVAEELLEHRNLDGDEVVLLIRDC